MEIAYSVGASSQRLPVICARVVARWLDSGKEEIATAYADHSYCWLAFKHHAAFRYSRGTGNVLVYTLETASPRAVLDTFYRSALPLFLQHAGYESLHASAVLTDSGVIAFCGISGTGKSTLAFRLSQLGTPIWTDDALVLDMNTDHPGSLAMPFFPRGIGNDPGQVLGQGEWIEESLTVHDRFDLEHVIRAPIAAVYLVDRPRGNQARIAEPVVSYSTGSGEALTGLLSHAYVFSLEDQERKRRMISYYAALAARVPVMRLTLPNGIERLDRIGPQLLANTFSDR